MLTTSKYLRPIVSKIQSDPLPSSRMISRIEAALLLVVFASLWVALFRFAKGGPVSTDVLYYFQLGQLRIADPFVLNRYFHIYLQKLFVDTTSSPLSGLQSLWAFLLAFSTIGVYLLGRLSTEQSTPLHGIMAAGLFVSLPSLSITAGVPYVDLTLAAMSTLLIILYLASLRLDHRSRWLLFALGLCAYLGIRTKEIFVTTAIVLIGLFWENKNINLRVGFKRLLPLLVGVLAGAILLQLCHWLVVGKPLFGLRAEDYQIFNDTYSTAFLSLTINTAHANVYSHFIFPFLAVPFLMFLLSISKITRSNFANKLIWIVPVVFLALESYFLKFYVEQDHRSFLPLLTIVCALAPQFISLSDKQLGNSNLINQAYHLGVGLLGALLMLGIKTLFIRAGEDSALYLDVVILPVTLTLIFIVQIGLGRGLPKSLILITLLFALIMPPIEDNLRALLIDQTNFQVFTLAAKPMGQLGRVVDLGSKQIVAIEQKAVITDSIAFYKDVNEVSTLFNLTNDAYTNKNNFDLLTQSAQIQSLMTCQIDYAYILLSQDSWDKAKSSGCITARYQIDENSVTNRVLLIRR